MSQHNQHSMQPKADDLIKVGELKKPYGIKGWLWVFSYTDDKANLFSLQPLWIKTATGMKPLTVKQWREQGVGLVAQFDQIPDRNVAETMHGTSIWADKNSFPTLEEDEYYWSDLVGLRVQNQTGDDFGVIKELFETAAHAIMVVKADNKSLDNEERLIPWSKQTVLDVDLPSGKVIVDWQADY